jgi:hypothetical protein
MSDAYRVFGQGSQQLDVYFIMIALPALLRWIDDEAGDNGVHLGLWYGALRREAELVRIT